MSTESEQIEAVRCAVASAERRLKELKSKRSLTLAETYEMDMTVSCIQRGNKILENVRNAAIIQATQRG